MLRNRGSGNSLKRVQYNQKKKGGRGDHKIISTNTERVRRNHFTGKKCKHLTINKLAQSIQSKIITTLKNKCLEKNTLLLPT